MKLKQIHRTSTFAWSPSEASALPLLATGTVAGALDESFSNESILEIWEPFSSGSDEEYELGGPEQPGPRGAVTDTARFNRLAWGHVNNTNSRGVIAAGLENGELALWDPAKILAGADSTESLILRNTIHTGPVRGLDFNPIQSNLLASGGVSGEVYIWDLKDPSKPYTPTPGTRSTKLDEITSVAWNQQVQYVLAGASSTGYTVVWDLRGKREVVALAYGGGSGTLAGSGGVGGYGQGALAGGRRGMSDIAWHPDNATRLVTASEDDSSPIIMVWDLRNARAPEKILTGHEKGILSLSWCKQDADLLLSCGKDNRALCWNPQTSEIIGELPSADNWAFQVDWCPRNPDLLATAFFDGTIGIHSIQNTNDTPAKAAAATPTTADIFGPNAARSSAAAATFSLKQPPKWLRRPVSSAFGIGGKLVTVSNLPSAETGKNQSSVVHLRNVVTEEKFVERAKGLQEAILGGGLEGYAVKRVADGEVEGTPDSAASEDAKESWKALLSLFKANSREELVTLLGFSKEEVRHRVEEAVERLKLSGLAVKQGDEEEREEEVAAVEERTSEPVVSFAEPEAEAVQDTSDSSETGEEPESGGDKEGEVDGESTTTVPSLFGEDEGPGTPLFDPTVGQDFFNTLNVASQQDNSTNTLPINVPHTNYGIDSSVAATVGSGPSSVTSEVRNARGEEESAKKKFRIYPEEESEVDRLITKALVLGDFESAVSLCLSSLRFADAILLAVRGGPSLLEKTQQAYFEKKNDSVRLLKSLVMDDLEDVVRNAELEEWREIFVVVCTFAGEGEERFGALVEQLGVRLEEKGIAYTDRAVESEEDEDDEEETLDILEKAKIFRKNATLTYLAAKKLERLIGIWGDELVEDEETLLEIAKGKSGGETASHFSVHAQALQAFIEKVTVFRAATSYKDKDLSASSVTTWKLAALYDRYLEYADLLTTQGLLKEAATILELTPSEYGGSEATTGVDRKAERERLVVATSPGKVGPGRQVASVASTSKVAGGYGYSGQRVPNAPAAPVYGGYQPPVVPYQQAGANAAYPPTNPSYAPTNAPYQPTNAPYQPNAPVAQPTQSQYAHQAYQHSSYQTPSAYAPPATNTAYALPPAAQQAHAPPPLPSRGQPAVGIPPPPRPANGTPSNATATPPPPPAIKRDPGGWNDAPSVLASSKRPTDLNLHKPAAITAPFASAGLPPVASPGFSPVGTPYMQQQGGAPLPPPPQRPGSVQGRGGPPPPPPGHRAGGVYPQPPPGPSVVRPPSTVGGPQRASTPVRYAPTPPPQARAVSIGGPPGPSPGQPQTHVQGHGQPQQYAPPLHPQQLQHQQHFQPGHQEQHEHSGHHQPPPNPYAPQRAPSSQLPPSNLGPGAPPHPPPPGGPIGGPGHGAPPAARIPSTQNPPPRQAPPPPKYPPGDRGHIPDNAKPAYEVILENLNRLKQSTPPNQTRLVDDLERRINPLFDALNCETLSAGVVEQLVVLTRAMQARDRPAALAIHVDLLTRGSQTDDIGMWMAGIKQLIMRL